MILIEKPSVIDIIANSANDLEYHSENQELQDMIYALPSVQLIKSHWVKVSGYATPGGDPVWACSNCGKGLHVYGIEHGTYGEDVADHQWVACPNCGAKMVGEE